MPESVDIPSTDKIADVDLSKQGVGIDISSGEYYTGRLYTPDDFAKGDISQGNPDDKYATFRIVLPLEKRRHLRTFRRNGDLCTTGLY